jgi:hypothetical protein
MLSELISFLRVTQFLFSDREYAVYATDITRTQYTKRRFLAPPEDEQVYSKHVEALTY